MKVGLRDDYKSLIFAEAHISKTKGAFVMSKLNVFSESGRMGLRAAVLLGLIGTLGISFVIGKLFITSLALGFSALSLVALGLYFASFFFAVEVKRSFTEGERIHEL